MITMRPTIFIVFGLQLLRDGESFVRSKDSRSSSGQHLSTSSSSSPGGWANLATECAALIRDQDVPASIRGGSCATIVVAAPPTTAPLVDDFSRIEKEWAAENPIKDTANQVISPSPPEPNGVTAPTGSELSRLAKEWSAVSGKETTATDTSGNVQTASPDAETARLQKEFEDLKAESAKKIKYLKEGYEYELDKRESDLREARKQIKVLQEQVGKLNQAIEQGEEQLDREWLDYTFSLIEKTEELFKLQLALDDAQKIIEEQKLR